MRDRLLERIERAQAAVAAATAAGAPETTQRYLRLAESAARGMRTTPRRRAAFRAGESPGDCRAGLRLRGR